MDNAINNTITDKIIARKIIKYAFTIFPEKLYETNDVILPNSKTVTISIPLSKENPRSFQNEYISKLDQNHSQIAPCNNTYTNCHKHQN